MKKRKQNFNRYISMFLVMLTFLGVMPLHVLANEVQDNSTITSVLIGDEAINLNEDGSFYVPHVAIAAATIDISTMDSTLRLSTPHVNSQTIDGLPMLLGDLSDWDVEIEEIEIETNIDYVNIMTGADFFAIVFPANVIPTAEHTFMVQVAVRGHSYPVLIGLNGLGTINFNNYQLIYPNDINTDNNNIYYGGINIEDIIVERANDIEYNPILGGYISRAFIDANPHFAVNPGDIFWDNQLDVFNWPYNAIVIRKIDITTGELLAGATFDLIDVTAGAQHPGGTQGRILGTFVTGHNGTIVITGLPPGTYLVEETIAPPNFTLALNNRQIAVIQPYAHSAVPLNFYNHPYGSLLITLRNSVTNLPLENGTFRVTNANGQVVGTGNGIFTTNNQGQILITNVPPGAFVIEQMTPPAGYRLGYRQVETIFVNASGQIYNVDFLNIPANQLTVSLRDSIDNQPLAGGIFRVTQIGGSVIGGSDGLFTTNNLGQFTVTIPPYYSIQVEQINAAPGHRLNALVGPISQNIQTYGTGRTYTLDFINEPYAGLTVWAIDNTNGDFIQGVTFEVRTQSGEFVGTFTTNNQGNFVLNETTGYPLLGWHTVTEVDVPGGFSDTATTVTPSAPTVRQINILPGQANNMRFYFDRIGGLQITLSNSVAPHQPLAGGRFEVRNHLGTLVQGAYHVTNAAGSIMLTDVPTGVLTVTPLQPHPIGFIIDQTAIGNVYVTHNDTTVVNFTATPHAGLVIYLETPNGTPLAGGTFVVRSIAGTELYRGTTSAGGTIIVSPQALGGVPSVVIEQIHAPSGWVMTDTSVTMNIVQGQINTARFINTQEATLVVNLTNPQGQPLAGGQFEVRDVTNNALITTGTTNATGQWAVGNITSGTFVVNQLQPAPGYVMTTVSQNITITAGQNASVTFINDNEPSLVIEKVDSQGNPLTGARFELRTLTGLLVYTGVTNQGGMITIPHLNPGSFMLTETVAPQGFVITEPSRAIEIVAGQTLTERFVNFEEVVITIEKVDAYGQPLAGATFEVRTATGDLIYRGVTNNGGLLTITGIAPGTIIIEETVAPEGFILDQPARTYNVVAGEQLTTRWVNNRRPVWTVQKIDGNTDQPLAGVVFELRTFAGVQIQNPVNNSFEFVTNQAGQINLPHLDPGTFVLTETRPLPGFMAVDPIIFTVGANNTYLITVRNYQYPDFNIHKISATTGLGMEGVVFQIAPLHANNTLGNPLRNPIDGSLYWTTDVNGIIRIPNLEHGTYVATEISTHPGYRLAEPAVFVVDGVSPLTLTITNHRYSEWNILNLDGHTNQGIGGGRFTVAHYWGIGTQADNLRNPLDGTFYFTADQNGLITLGVLEPGTYIVTQVTPPTGFNLAEAVIFVVADDSPNTTVTVRNYRPANLTIQLIQTITRTPIEGAIFNIYLPSGARVTNTATGFFDFITDSNGIIHLPIMEDGNYILRQISTLPGLIMNEEPIHFTIDASARQREHVLVVENAPASGLLIVVEDASGNGMAGVELEIRRPDGSIVTGQMMAGNQPGTAYNSPQIMPNGNFLTNASGRVNLNHLEPGVFHVRVVNAPNGVQFNADVHVVTVLPGEQAVLNIVLETLAGLRLYALNAITGQGLFNVEFDIVS